MLILPLCPYCNEAHVSTYKCNAYMANRDKPMANDVANFPTAEIPLIKKLLSRTYKYRDPEKRREYMRAYMRKKRSGAPST